MTHKETYTTYGTVYNNYFYYDRITVVVPQRAQEKRLFFFSADMIIYGYEEIEK